MAPREITSLTDLLDCLAGAGVEPGEDGETGEPGEKPGAGGAPGEVRDQGAAEGPINPRGPDRIPAPAPREGMQTAPARNATSGGWNAASSEESGDPDDEDGQPGDEDPITLDEMLDAIGRRSFGPLLLLPGIIVVAPVVGDIPTVPTLMALVILLVAGQLLLRRGQFWLPGWLTRRSVKRKRVRKAVKGLRKPAGWVDRILKRRLTVLTGDAGSMVIAATCVIIAVAIPPMELIPFTATVAGTAVAGFGLALIAEDGLMALLSFAFTVGSLWWGASALL